MPPPCSSRIPTAGKPGNFPPRCPGTFGPPSNNWKNGAGIFEFLEKIFRNWGFFCPVFKIPHSPKRLLLLNLGDFLLNWYHFCYELMLSNEIDFCYLTAKSRKRELLMSFLCQTQSSRAYGDNLPFSALVPERSVAGKDQTEITFVLSRFRGL